MSDTSKNGPDKPATPLRPGQAGALAAGFGQNQPKRFCGKPGRSGPPAGNTNALRHGLKAGKLPKQAQYIEHQMNRLRRELEDAVMQAKDEVNLLDAAHIQTAIKWERHGALALRWLRLEGDTLKPADRLAFSREIARASAERDRALAALGLDAPPKPLNLAGYLAEKHGDDDEA